MAEKTPNAANAASTPGNAPPPGGSSGLVWGVLAMAVFGIVLGIVLYKSQRKTAPRQMPPVVISTTNAFQGDIDVIANGLGTVTPVYTAWMSPRVDGQIVKVNYTEGQMVTTNDLLVEIDPKPYEAQVEQAEGQLARDKAQLEGANVDLERFQAAYSKEGPGGVLHAVPKQQVDDQRALVHQYQGAVRLDEGNLANAKVQLAYCFIRAPFTGRVGLRLLDPGNVVHAANTNALVAVTQLQPITVVFTVDEKYLPAIQRQIQAGHTMRVEAWSADETQKLTTGTFLTMDNMIDVSTRTIRIKAMFDNKDLMLFPNQFVNPKLIIETLHGVTLVPTPAIQYNPQGSFVYTVGASNEVRMQSVTIGITEGDVKSVQGLKPGTMIATDNFNKLGDGMIVQLRQTGGKKQDAGGLAKSGAGVKPSKPAEDPR